jgi:hypothetical protein
MRGHGGVDGGGSNHTGAASRGAEWWLEVAGCGGGVAELGWSQREVMIGGTHLSAGHGEGQRRHEVRRFPVREAAIGQGATDARPTGPRAQAGPAERLRPSGERESGRLGKEKGSGLWLGQKPELGPISSNKTFLNFIWNLNFWQLWKFVQGDLEGILTWEFFLDSSGLLKDFRKI